MEEHSRAVVTEFWDRVQIQALPQTHVFLAEEAILCTKDEPEHKPSHKQN